MQHPLTRPQRHPHPARQPPRPSTPWKDPSATAEDRESGRKRQHWLGCLPTGRGGHRRAESAGQGCQEGQCYAPGRHGYTSGHRDSTAAVPKRAHLDSSPAGDSNQQPLRSPRKRVCAQTPPPKRATIGHNGRPSSEAQSTSQAHHSLQHRGRGCPIGRLQ